MRQLIESCPHLPASHWEVRVVLPSGLAGGKQVESFGLDILALLLSRIGRDLTEGSKGGDF